MTPFERMILMQMPANYWWAAGLRDYGRGSAVGPFG